MNYLKLSLLSSVLLISSFSYADNWMTALPDDVPVRELSIPGSHDAATGNGFTSSIAALISGVTQSLSLTDQWDAGVRAFDLRPAYKSSVDGKLQIYHGILETKLSMKAALQTLVDKLTACPGEMAVILMRHESDSDSNSSEWGSAASDLFGEFDEYLVPFDSDLTLGTARGKILVLSRDGFTSDKVGIITGWSHSENFDSQKNAAISLSHNRATLYVQDYYEASSADSKWQSFKTMLDYSLTNTKIAPWVINHTSGYVGSGTNANVRNLAKTLNKQAAEYIDATDTGRTGIVMMDFAGAASASGTAVNGDLLVNKIAAQNAKYIKDEPQTSVLDLTEDNAGAGHRIFDMQGRCLGIGPEKLNTLPAGIYIIGKKKIYVRH